MEIFIDTADIKQIKEALSWGILDGVTTNPTHISKTARKFRDVAEEICKMVPGPVSLETVTLTADEIYKEGKELAKIANNVVVKVPITKEGLKAIKRLSDSGIKVNVTVTFSPVQALLVAKAGATYVSPFVGRLDAIAHDGMELVRQIRKIYDNYNYKTQILAAAIRHPMHVLQAAMAGADVCTMSYDVMEMLLHHPLTDKGIEIFLADWAKVPK